MPDYSKISPPNLFPAQQPSQQAGRTGQAEERSRSLSSETTRTSESPPFVSRRRAKEKMGEGYYTSFDEIVDSESPSKRARTESPSDHGTVPFSCYMALLL